MCKSFILLGKYYIYVNQATGKNKAKSVKSTQHSRNDKLNNDENKKPCDDINFEQKLNSLKEYQLQLEADIPEDKSLRNELMILQMKHRTATEEFERRISRYEELMKLHEDVIKKLQSDKAKMEEELYLLRGINEKVNKNTTVSVKRTLLYEGIKIIFFYFTM